MSNYYMAVNHANQEYIHGLAIAANDPPTYGVGLKEHGMFHGDVSHLLTFILSDTEKGRQRWAGGNIQIVSDSARGMTYQAFEYIQKEESGYKDVTKEAIDAWNAAKMEPLLKYFDWNKKEEHDCPECGFTHVRGHQ